jgi:hypothetical protein
VVHSLTDLFGVKAYVEGRCRQKLQQKQRPPLVAVLEADRIVGKNGSRETAANRRGIGEESAAKRRPPCCRASCSELLAKKNSGRFRENGGQSAGKYGGQSAANQRQNGGPSAAVLAYGTICFSFSFLQISLFLAGNSRIITNQNRCTRLRRQAPGGPGLPCRLAVIQNGFW